MRASRDVVVLKIRGTLKNRVILRYHVTVTSLEILKYLESALKIENRKRQKIVHKSKMKLIKM